MPAVTVHDLGQARRAARIAADLGRPLTLLSAPGAAASLGPAVFKEMIDAALTDIVLPADGITAILDCGQDAGYALRAIREGCRHVRLDAPSEVLERVGDIAAQRGATCVAALPEALDLNGDVSDVQLKSWIVERKE